MKINNARAIAKLLYILLRLKILTYKQYDSMIDQLTVKALQHELLKQSTEEI